MGPRSPAVDCGLQHIRPEIQPDGSTAVSYRNRLADQLCSRPGQARRKADDVRVMHRFSHAAAFIVPNTIGWKPLLSLREPNVLIAERLATDTH
jgi:hypothetical protein